MTKKQRQALENEYCTLYWKLVGLNIDSWKDEDVERIHELEEQLGIKE